MIVFPNAKINIGLNVVSKRADGFHNLETIFYPVKLADALEIVDSDKTELSVSGIPIDGILEDNLVLKAYHLLKKDYNLPALKFHLHKVIPFGAGLGGGSSDAAFTLKMLNDYFKLGLTFGQLTKYAAQIGSDCTFFISNKPAFATGVGDQLQGITLTLSEFKIIIVKPSFSVSTPEAYKDVTPAKPRFSLKEINLIPITDWREVVVNDFEKNIFEKYPEIRDIKETLYDMGAVYASMSGSGSSVFGIFRHLPVIPDKFLPKGIFIYR
jgi:4-diphosphocytidyl-2-C-methyl-D-erythritol kinase